MQVVFPDGLGVGTGELGQYRLVYPAGIEIYGASFSGYLGDANIAGEFSVRRRMPLASTALIELPGIERPGIERPGVSADADHNPLYARGSTLHAQVSVVSLLSPTGLWDAASLSGELAANRRLRIARNAAVRDPTRDTFAAGFRAAFEPTYFAVMPGLDVSVPLSIGLGVIGRSSIDTSQTAGAGSMELGLAATYRTVWKANLAYTHFIGGPNRQPFADRDFISLSLQRTF